MNIAIIGAGAAGLMCGACLAKNGIKVTIFDGNEKTGKKIYITGKGRCNLTNACQPKEFLENVVRGKKFMQGAINKFSSEDCIKFFENNGLKLKIERGQRVFPNSDKASDVIKTLTKLNDQNEIILNNKVLKIDKAGDKFKLKTENGQFTFDKVIVATGGVSYPLTGSTGIGYKIAKSFGHHVIDSAPALAAIELKDKFVGAVQALPLKNVEIIADFEENEKFVQEIKPLKDVKLVQKKGENHVQARIFGEMMFTDIGITGPIILTLSSIINRANNIKLAIDFKPALSSEQLNTRLLRDFDENKNKNLSHIIHLLLPKNFVTVFLDKIKLDGNKKVNSVTKEERFAIVCTLKHFDLDYKSIYPIQTGVVTSGGVDLKEISPKSCESKIIKNLYFIGEVLDVDCLTGGFNLQVAFSTGFACADAISNEILNG